MRHSTLRTKCDRDGKKARCACGWEGPWRRGKDASKYNALVRADMSEHLVLNG